MRRMFSLKQLEEIANEVSISNQQNIEKYGDLIKTWNGGLTEIAGLTFTGVYCKIVRNFNELQFIMNFRVSNSTDASITINADTKLCEFVKLPDELLTKIYAHSGLNLKELNANNSVAYASLFISQTGGAYDSEYNPRYVNLYFIKSNERLAFYLEGGNVQISAGQTRDFEARISLAL